VDPLSLAPVRVGRPRVVRGVAAAPALMIALAALALAGVTGARADDVLYLLCAAGEPVEDAAADAVMVDRANRRIVWMERLGQGEWRRTTYVIEASTPAELSGRAERDGEALHLTLDLAGSEFEREWPRPRGDNVNVWDADAQRLGFPPGVQLYVRDAGSCRAAR